MCVMLHYFWVEKMCVRGARIVAVKVVDVESLGEKGSVVPVHDYIIL